MNTWLLVGLAVAGVLLLPALIFSPALPFALALAVVFLLVWVVGRWAAEEWLDYRKYSDIGKRSSLDGGSVRDAIAGDDDDERRGRR